MPLEWTHEPCKHPACTGTTSCPGFPTVADRVSMARSAYAEYAESDDTSLIDFALDVLLLVQSENESDSTLLARIAKQAHREYTASKRRVHPKPKS